MIDKTTMVKIILKMAEKISENKELLNQLDKEIGDGDHGTNMNRGFEAVKSKIDTIADMNIETQLKTLAMTLISTVGGASGPLYGTAFLRASVAIKAKENLEIQDLISIYEAAISGIKERGQSEKGQKTMLDSMIPALETMIENKDEAIKIILERASRASWDGVEYTKSIIALKGRASFLGERSIGHQDPGATSASIILDAIRESI